MTQPHGLLFIFVSGARAGQKLYATMQFTLMSGPHSLLQLMKGLLLYLIGSNDNFCNTIFSFIFLNSDLLTNVKVKSSELCLLKCLYVVSLLQKGGMLLCFSLTLASVRRTLWPPNDTLLPDSALFYLLLFNN